MLRIGGGLRLCAVRPLFPFGRSIPSFYARVSQFHTLTVPRIFQIPIQRDITARRQRTEPPASGKAIVETTTWPQTGNQNYILLQRYLIHAFFLQFFLNKPTNQQTNKKKTNQIIHFKGYSICCCCCEK